MYKNTTKYDQCKTIIKNSLILIIKKIVIYINDTFNIIFILIIIIIIVLKNKEQYLNYFKYYHLHFLSKTNATKY